MSGDQEGQDSVWLAARCLQGLAEKFAIVGDDARATDLHGLARRLIREATVAEAVLGRGDLCLWCPNTTVGDQPLDTCCMPWLHKRADGSSYVDAPRTAADIYAAAESFAEEHYGLPWCGDVGRDLVRQVVKVKVRRAEANVPTDWRGFRVEVIR